MAGEGFTLNVISVEKIIVDLPFDKRVEHHMHRASTHGERVNGWRVETDDGFIGYGEGPGGKSGIARVTGQNPFEFLNDDSIGFGIQMALYDVVGKAAGVPAYRLLGPKVRGECPISWWAIDMPPEDWARETKAAVQLGYTSIKVKARPWRDIFAQLDAIRQAVCDGFKLGIDFNGFLLNAGNAMPVLSKLEQNDLVELFEEPIPEWDIEGYKQLRSKVMKPICIHVGVPPIMTALQEEMVDGFVIHGNAATPGVMEVKREATIMAFANKPFWLQMVGSGITAAFTVHLGAVLTHAQWPAITCHELWADDLLKERLEVRNGYIRVPEKPGLGVEVDESAIQRYRVDPRTLTPKEKSLQSKRVLRIRWPPLAGQARHAICFTSESDYQKSFYQGNLPLFVPGVDLEVEEDDGSLEFAQHYERIRLGTMTYLRPSSRTHQHSSTKSFDAS